jgi:hypothetical protein
VYPAAPADSRVSVRGPRPTALLGIYKLNIRLLGHRVTPQLHIRSSKVTKAYHQKGTAKCSEHLTDVSDNPLLRRIFLVFTAVRIGFWAYIELV